MWKFPSLKYLAAALIVACSAIVDCGVVRSCKDENQSSFSASTSTTIPISTTKATSEESTTTLKKTEQYSDSDQENADDCLAKRKVMYDGFCYELLTRGPCEDEHYLLLDEKLLDVKENETNFQAICKKKRCPDQDIYFPESDSCVSETDQMAVSTACPFERTILQRNEFGYGICQCATSMDLLTVRVPPHEYDPFSPCYELYTRGPCGQKEIILLSEKGYGKCEENDCWPEQQKFQNATGKSNQIFARWTKGDGMCHPLYTRGPCENNELFRPHPHSAVPVCWDKSKALNEFNLISPPTFCNTNYEGECEGSNNVIIQSTNYKKQLLAAAKVEEKRKRRESK